MKKIIIFTTIILLIIAFAGLVVYGGLLLMVFRLPEPHVRPKKEWSTQYTEEEHIERISQRARSQFLSQLPNGNAHKCDVDLIYSFDELPRFFVVEIEYIFVNQDGYFTDYAHVIGEIYEDEYLLIMSMYGDEFSPGKSIYSLSEKKGKKYYGSGVYAVNVDGAFYRLYDERDCYDTGRIYDGESLFENHQHYKKETECSILDYRVLNIDESNINQYLATYVRIPYEEIKLGE